jgi:hypothetical protein
MHGAEFFKELFTASAASVILSSVRGQQIISSIIGIKRSARLATIRRRGGLMRIRSISQMIAAMVATTLTITTMVEGDSEASFAFGTADEGELSMFFSVGFQIFRRIIKQWFFISNRSTLNGYLHADDDDTKSRKYRKEDEIPFMVSLWKTNGTLF